VGIFIYLYDSESYTFRAKAAKQMLSEAKLQKANRVDDYLSGQGICWNFIVELAPWMGGFYERLVGLTKTAIRKTLGKYLTEK